MNQDTRLLANAHSYYQPSVSKDEYYLDVPPNCTDPGMHWHVDTEIVHNITGATTVMLDGHSYEMKPGDTMLIRSAIEHNVVIHNGETVIVEFGYALLGQEYRIINHSRFCRTLLHSYEDTRFVEVFTALRTSFFSKCKDIWFEKSELFLLASILRSYCIPAEDDDSIRMKRILDFEKILPAFKLVELRYKEPIQTLDVANATGYTESHFCRLFHEIMGETFHSYLNRYRILFACKLLEQGNYGINEIALRVGMPIEKTFTRAFKRYIGCTPAKYLQKHDRPPSSSSNNSGFSPSKE